MVKKSKQFISKNEGQHFYLVHRSQTDSARGNEQEPSEFVLIPASDNGNDTRRKLVSDAVQGIQSYYDGSSDTSRNRSNNLPKDHINELGFRNDGYDYSKHLKVIDGAYMNAEGQWVTPEPKEKRVAFELPEDSLPSQTEFARDYNAITIDPEIMDEDLHAALFNDCDEDDFEELQDDFVSVAMQEPELPDFDFDAHIAALIERSEKNCTRAGANVAPRGWETDRDKEMLRHAHATEYDEDSDGQFSDTLEDYEGTKYTTNSYYSNYTATSLPFSTASKNNPERRALEDRRFEETVAEYDDAELGYCSDADSVEGAISLDGDDPLFTQAIEEFLQDQKDLVLVEGVLVNKGARAVPSECRGKLQQKGYGELTAEEMTRESDTLGRVMSELEIKLLAEEQKRVQLEYAAMLSEQEDKFDELRTCQEYLREERVDEQWDCESVLSTYSTLDNHPSLIKEPGSSKFRKHKSRLARDQEAAALESESNFDGKAALIAKSAGILPPQRIELTGKLSLPVGFGMSAHSNVKRADGSSVLGGYSSHRGVRFEDRHSERSVTSVSRGLKAKKVEGRVERECDEVLLEAEGEGEGEESDEDDDFSDWTIQTRKGETPEEKKARKAAIKADRRVKRQNKKVMKEIYKVEGIRQIVATGRKQEIDHVSVFRYTK